ncbi:MAG TPA: hypothetical protein VKN36_04100 [Eudoraea sp.]|nr:hypothetical protein [Eudoraea sp.]
MIDVEKLADLPLKVFLMSPVISKLYPCSSGIGARVSSGLSDVQDQAVAMMIKKMLFHCRLLIYPRYSIFEYQTFTQW